jgi:hypothetical protein
VSKEDRAWALAATTDLAFRKAVIPKIAKLDIDNATLDDVVALFGEPAMYCWGNDTFQKGNLPRQYILSYPDHFDVYMRDGKIIELRYYNPGYIVRESLQVGSSLEDVLKVLGPPVETVEGKNNEFKDGVLYKDMNGWKGYCYYARADKGVRLFITDNKVAALHVTRSNYLEIVKSATTKPKIVDKTSAATQPTTE